MERIFVIKRNGELVNFDRSKIYTIIGVVTVYRTNDEREFDFCLNLVTVEE